MYLFFKKIKNHLYIDLVHFRDSIHRMSGVEFRKLILPVRLQWEASWSCTRLPQDPRQRWLCRPHHHIPAIIALTPAVSRPKRRKSLIIRTVVPISGNCSLCSSGLMHSQATSRQPLKKCQIGYLLNPTRRAFFLAEQCLRLGTASSEENWAPLTFYFSHYSSHCLKSNFTSALFCQGRN